MKHIIYAIFLLIPFANESVGGHIYPVEIPLILGFLLIPIALRKSAIKLTTLDILVGAYALFSLVPVAVGLDSLYVSARYYRLMVLTPVLIYVTVRFSSLSLTEVRKALLFMLPGIFIQGLLLLRYYMIHGERPVGVEGAASTVTLGVLFCIGLFIIIFGTGKNLRGLIKGLRFVLVIAFGLMLLVTFSRVTIVGFVLLTPFINTVWRKLSFRKLLGPMILSVLCVLLIFMLVGGKISYTASTKIGDEKAIQHSIGRLYKVDLYLKDLGERFVFWGRLIRGGLEHPIFGSGASSYTIGRLGGIQFQLGSSHNILVSTIITSGLIGLFILLLIIRSAYKLLNRFNSGNRNVESLGKILLSSFTILLMVSLTNDFTGGRIFIWFFLLSLIAKISAESEAAVKQQKNIVPEGCK